MRLSSPCPSINFKAKTIYGEPISLRDFRGTNVMLCFFRDAACPFCNFRIYELCNNYKEWQQAGLEIIAVFSSTAEEVRHYVANHPRPFHLIADPDLSLYNRYGVEHSAGALFKAITLKLPRIIKGFKTGGYPSNNPHYKIVPADFLIDTSGKVTEVWYGRDTADHIPLLQVQRFIDRSAKQLLLDEREQRQRLQNENRQLKQLLRQIKSHYERTQAVRATTTAKP